MNMRFELIKVLRKTSSKIALFVLAGVLILACYLTADVFWVNEQGIREYGHAAAMKLRDAQKEWAGTLDEEKLRQALAEIQRIAASPEAKSKDVTQNEIAYSRGQGVKEIRSLLNFSFASDFSSYDYFRAETVRAEEVGSFYSNRIRLLKNWLNDPNGSGCDRFSPAEKEFLIQQYESLETPFSYDYMGGWTHAAENSTLLITLCAVILGYLVSSIFADEFRWHTDALFFTTMRGRNSAIWDKIKAGLVLVTVVYWLSISIYTVFTLLYFGSDGANCFVQADFTGWKCIYHLTNLQRYGLIVLLGYIGNLFFALLIMWISAKTKSAVFAVTAPFIAIFIPWIFENLNIPWVMKVLSILPDRLLCGGETVAYFDLIELGGRVMGAVPVIGVLYVLLTLLLIPICYRQFSKSQVI